MWTAIKGEITSNITVVGDFNIPLWSTDRSSRQKMNKKIQALNDSIDQIELMDIYRAFHPKAAEYTFFSNAHGTFSRIDHMLGHKVCLSKCKKIEIMSGIFSSHSALRLGVNCKEKN